MPTLDLHSTEILKDLLALSTHTIMQLQALAIYTHSSQNSVLSCLLSLTKKRNPELVALSQFTFKSHVS